MSTLGMDDDLLYGPANTDLMDWPQGMIPEEVSQDPAPCSTTQTDKQEIELLREQVRALKEENQVLKLSYAKLLKTKTSSSGSKNVSNSKLLILVQQELEQKKILCENLAQKAGFYKSKYKSLKSSMFSQAMQQYNKSPSEEAVCTPDKPSRSTLRDRTSAHSLVGNQLKYSTNIHATLPITGPRLLNLPSVSSDLSQEESSSNIKPNTLESHRQVSNLVPEDPQLMICHLANMTNSETPSTSLADEEAFQARQRHSGRDRPKVFELSYLPDTTLGKREPKAIEDEEPIDDCPVSPIIQTPTEAIVTPAIKPLELGYTCFQHPPAPVHTDATMDLEPSPLPTLPAPLPAHVSTACLHPQDYQEQQPTRFLAAAPTRTMLSTPSTQTPSQPIDDYTDPHNADPSLTLAADHTRDEHGTNTKEESTTPDKLEHKQRPVLPQRPKRLAKAPVRISHGTSDEEEESSLESEAGLVREAGMMTQMREEKVVDEKVEKGILGPQSILTPPAATNGPGIGIFSLQVGQPKQATFGRLSKPAFLEAQEIVPKSEDVPKPKQPTQVLSGWSKVYSTCWKLVENLQNAQNQSHQTEIKEQFVQLLNLFREIASKDVDAKAVYPPTAGASPLDMLLQQQLQEKQYSVKQVLNYQPESGESKIHSCQQFVVQTICFLIFISNYQDCSEVKELALQSGVFSSGLISDPLLQSKFLKLQEIVASSQRRNSTSSTKSSTGHYGLLRVAFEHLVFVCERQIVPFNTQDLFMSNLLAQKASFNELRDAGHYAAEKAGRAGLNVPFFTDLEDLLAATRLLFHTMKNLGTGFQRTAHQTLRGFFSNRKYRNTAQQLVACLLLRQAAHANF